MLACPAHYQEVVFSPFEGSDGWGDLDFAVGAAAPSGTAAVMQWSERIIPNTFIVTLALVDLATKPRRWN